jgi:hypothetical protein
MNYVRRGELPVEGKEENAIRTPRRTSVRDSAIWSASGRRLRVSQYIGLIPPWISIGNLGGFCFDVEPVQVGRTLEQQGVVPQQGPVVLLSEDGLRICIPLARCATGTVGCPGKPPSY